MKILQIHKYFYARDGASNYALHLSDLLRTSGNTVIPFAMKQEQSLPTPYSKFFVSERDLSDPARATLGDKIRTVGTMLYSREAKHNIAALLEQEPDVAVAHLHNIYHHISPSILPVLKRRGVKIVMTLHDYKLLSPNYTMFHHGAVHEEDAAGWYLSCVKNTCMKNSRMQSAIVAAEMIWHHKIMKYYERYVDRFIAPSRFMLNTCVRHGWDEKKFVHIPHPIDTSAYAPSKNDGIGVAYIGRLSEEKGLHTLLDAAKRMPHIPVTLVGDGPLGLSLRRRVSEEHIANVTFTGFESGDALAARILSARVLVLPSIWYENYPLSVLEAKAAGKIIIGSRIGGIPELLPQDLLVRPSDPEELANRLSLWYDKELSARHEKGRELRLSVEQENNPDEHTERIEALYRSVCK